MRSVRVSVLFNEPKLLKCRPTDSINRNTTSFSALQRAEIAEIDGRVVVHEVRIGVSVLFNEPKLLKFPDDRYWYYVGVCFSALQRAEIAEIREAR